MSTAESPIVSSSAQSGTGPAVPRFLLFPGQGAQRAGMLEGWDAFAPVRDAVAEAEAVLGLPFSAWMLEGPAEALRPTAHAQPALLALGVGVARLLLDRGLQPAAAAGHSLGEITALTVAESLDYGDALRLTHLRGQAMQRAVPAGQGSMVALLGMADDRLEAVLAAGANAGTVVAANHNAPGQVVLSGDVAAVEAALLAAREQGVRRTMPLDVSAPFHSPRMAPAAEELDDFLAELPLAPPRFPVWSNARLAPHGDRAEDLRAALVEQVTAPVAWVEQVRRMAPTVPGLEIAPAGVLRGLCRRILPDWEVQELRRPADAETWLADG